MYDTANDSSQASNLLTPSLEKDDSLVFPGENWFFYWKTGAALWSSKLAEYSLSGPLLVPINWSFHVDTEGRFDFADVRPETDLAKLVSLAEQRGRKISFLLPCSPAPFLPNGGPPHLLARRTSFYKNGILQSAIDASGEIHKLYSFFDTRIFQGYARFVKAMGEYFTRSGINADVWGMEAGYIGPSGFESFFLDFSRVYQQSFVKFQQVGNDNEGEQTHRDFVQLIRNTYIETAKEELRGHWEGVVKVAFLGASPENFFERIEGSLSPLESFHTVLKTLSMGILPSSVLLPSEAKQGNFDKMLNDLVIETSQKRFQKAHHSEWDNTFSSLKFFELYHTQNLAIEGQEWSSLGVSGYLQKVYPWSYLDREDNVVELSDPESLNRRIHFFQGAALNRKDVFNRLLGLFMSGGHIVINETGMPLKYRRRLETFFLENSLCVDKIKLYTEVRHVLLGDARLILFEGHSLTQFPREKMFDFWDRLIGIFELNHLSLSAPPGVETYWRSRSPGTGELSYEDVRRLSIYNLLSYKRKLEFSLPRTFRLLKIVDQIHAQVYNNPGGITVELMPDSSVSLDFGVFS